MTNLVGLRKEAEYREVDATLPEKPVSLPYELRTEMTWVDFCNPVNPMGTPKQIVQTIHAALVDGELNYSPDRDAHAFRNSLGKYFGLSSEWILAGTSANQMIAAAALAFSPCKVGISTPCPAEYMIAIGNAGHECVAFTNSISFSALDAYSARAEFGDFDGAVLANPAYPTSRLLSQQILVHYLETSSWVIVDESNIELSFGAESAVPLCKKYPNLIVVRSPSTTFSMPGTPLSYMVANPDTIARIRKTYGGDDISMFAEVLSDVIVSLDGYIDDTHEFLDKEIPWMQCMISLIPGVSIYPAEGNFVLCEFKSADGIRLGVTCADELVVRLQLAGFLVRRLEDAPGLEGEGFFCVCVRCRQDNERLLSAMRNIINVSE